MSHTQWLGGRAGDLARVNELEAEFSVRLPDLFKEIVLVADGSMPEPSEFPFLAPDKVGGFDWVVVGGIYPFVADKWDSALAVNRRLRDTYPGLVVFAHDAGGWLLAFDYRVHSVAPAVVALRDDVGFPDNVVPLAETFDAFVAGLREGPSPSFPVL